MRIIKRKYHYFYKITNNLNGHYYYGIHSTDNLNDGYMGSGTRLKYAYEKYGIENFTKEILEFFDTREDAAKYEAEVVNEVLIRDDDCYNIVLGGETRRTLDTATVKDVNGNIFQIPLGDFRIESGEFVGVTKGYVTAKDHENNTCYVSVNDPRYLSGELMHLHKGLTKVIDKNGNTFSVSVEDDRIKTGELTIWSKGKITVKDNKGNYYHVSVNDPRYLSGELKPSFSGKKHKQETKEKLKETYKNIKHQQGEKNSQYGTCWITKDNINKKIKKEELEIFEQQGWKKGRVMK